MINALTTKLELDVMLVNEVDQAALLASAHKLPAIVVHPQLVTQAAVSRIRRAGSYKIITTIDWPRGDIYGINKLRGLTKEMMEIDGYEILVTGSKTEIEVKNEVKTISDFIRNNIGKHMEVRFVLGCLTRPESEIMAIARVMRDIQAPALLRTDTHLRAQVSKASLKSHVAMIAAIRTECGLPLKLSGNLDSVRIIAGCMATTNPPSRFAVNTQQLQLIIKDLQKQPDELHRLLNAGAQDHDAAPI